MAITAWFTTYSGNPKKVNKDVSFSGDGKTISAYETIDDLTCKFILDGHGYHGVNYMKVSWDGNIRYYFIENRSGLTGNRTSITASCDVLYTYASNIKNASAVLNRTSNNTYVNSRLRDSQVLTLSGAIPSSLYLVNNILDDTEYYYVGVVQAQASSFAT